jgi:two-component system, cell cycle sensor histidine kinase PleC
MLLTFLIGGYFKIVLIDTLVKNSVEQQVELLLENYKRNIWDRFYPVISYLYTQPTSEWPIYPQYQAFQNESKTFFHSDSLIKVVIYNNNDHILFDTHNKLEISEQSGGFASLMKSGKRANNLIDAKNGTQSYSLISDVKVGKDEDPITVFNIFIPLKTTTANNDPNTEKAQGVIEFNFNITALYNSIGRIQAMMVFVVAMSLSFFVSIIIFASKKAENVIEKQQEESVEMSSAKLAAESESKAKSQFLANVSHELRTPLNAIIGFSEIISSESMGPVGNDQYKEFTKDIHTSGVHLLSLINDILDFSKAEENKLQIDLEQTDLTKIIKICMRMVLPRAEEAKVKLIETTPNEHIVIIADPKRLKQAILNLLSNAVKFTPENGEVTLKVWKDMDNNSVIIEVKDTGVGMAAQDLAKALSPFGQVDNKLSRRYEGTGLGLPLTKKLVELMKGRFDIRSEPSLGTAILLTFPLPSNEIEPTTSIT